MNWFVFSDKECAQVVPFLVQLMQQEVIIIGIS